MSTSQKVLKIIAIITILSGISYVLAALAFAGLGAFGGSDVISLEDMPIAIPANIAGGLFAVLAGITAVIYLLLGIFGLRGANVPSKIMPVYNLSVIAIVFSAIQVIVWEFTRGDTFDFANAFSVFIGLAEAILIFTLARNIRKDHETWH